MHEHMGDDLPEAKIFVFRKPKCKKFGGSVVQKIRTNKENDVYRQQHLDGFGYPSHLHEFFIELALIDGDENFTV